MFIDTLRGLQKTLLRPEGSEQILKLRLYLALKFKYFDSIEDLKSDDLIQDARFMKIIDKELTSMNAFFDIEDLDLTFLQRELLLDIHKYEDKLSNDNIEIDTNAKDYLTQYAEILFGELLHREVNSLYGVKQSLESILDSFNKQFGSENEDEDEQDSLGMFSLKVKGTKGYRKNSTLADWTIIIFNILLKDLEIANELENTLPNGYETGLI